MPKDKKKPSSLAKNVGNIFVVVIMIYACVALLPVLNAKIDTIANNSTVSNQVAQVISYNIGSPTWVLILGLFLIIGLGIAWYFGIKRKFSWLGDEDETES
jgi:hypothetical protein